MKMAFEHYLRTQTQLSEAGVVTISGLTKERRLRRNEPLLAAGEVSKYKIFVQSGLLMAYTILAEGNEAIFYFLQERTSTSLDVEGYERQSPASLHVAAIEPSGLLTWNKRDFDRLLAELPALKTYADHLGARKVYLGKQRLMTGSPEEKYEQFKRDDHELLARTPLHLIAACLGISVKTLTRIRHAQLAR